LDFVLWVFSLFLIKFATDEEGMRMGWETDTDFVCLPSFLIR